MEEADAIIQVHGLLDQHVSHRVSSFSVCLGQGLKDLILLEPAGTHLWRLGDLLKSSQWWLLFVTRSQIREQPLPPVQQRESTWIPSDSCLVTAPSCWTMTQQLFQSVTAQSSDLW